MRDVGGHGGMRARSRPVLNGTSCAVIKEVAPTGLRSERASDAELDAKARMRGAVRKRSGGAMKSRQTGC